jgi:hypothetical protein
MAKITVSAMKSRARTRKVEVLLIQISILDDIWAISCNGDSVGHECPGDIEQGDTWSDLGACVANAIAHVEQHEDREA